jgi:hypothetical protein
MVWTGENRIGKKLSPLLLSAPHSSWISLEANPGLSTEKPVSNRLSYVAAFVVIVGQMILHPSSVFFGRMARKCGK